MNIQHMRDAYKSMAKNFMTPEVIDFQICGTRLIELSKGAGIEGRQIWGVSELEWTDDCKWTTTRNGNVFDTVAKARHYYKKLIAK